MPHARRLISLALLTLPLTASTIVQAQRGSSVPQSPIDIASAHSCVTTLPPLVIQRRIPPREVWLNTGSPDEHATVRANVWPDAGGIELDGKTFELIQFHLHTPGEHTVNRRGSAMEIHYVHRAQDGSQAVVAQLVNEGPASAPLNALLTQLPASASDRVSFEHFEPIAPGLQPPPIVQPRSFRYTGSLTTPPYGGPISWIVLAEPITASAQQMARFRSIFPDGNSREVQPIDGRIVRTDLAGFANPCPPRARR